MKDKIVVQEIDGITYRLKSKQDFSFIKKYGNVFSCVDETGSGCICFGVENKKEKLFIKIAGADTIENEVGFEESKRLLKDSIKMYEELKHENLIELVKAYKHKDYYVAVFKYAEGECLFDHWNFDYYKENNITETPMRRFKNLSVSKRIDVVKKLFSFFEFFIDKGYVAVDFYDSSIIYDFENDNVTFCDIDLFEEMPIINSIGENYYGTKRLKAPEESKLGAVIDEKTSLFTLGALIFDFFSEVKNKKERYEKGMFIHNDFNDFELSKEVYDVLLKATSYDRNKRFSSIKEFEIVFFKALNMLK